MLTIYSDRHRLQDGRVELIDGEFKPCFERPERADLILQSVRDVALGPIEDPHEHPDGALAAVHTPAYLAFLQSAWDEWEAAHGTCDALPINWPTRGLRDVEPAHIDGKLGYYSFDAGTPITAGTWQAARSAVDVALTARERVARRERAVFALCRPPGHHAGADSLGGYCFLNNAAITAQATLEEGASRVAILDIDYHHGNGTQSIFYGRDDVLFVSLHGDPSTEFPFFLGYADEKGTGAGEGANRNYPLPWGTAFAQWHEALNDGCAHIARYAPDVLVVSLGVDTFEGDPISRFRLQHDDYLRVGERIAALGLPTVFIMEGGYAVEAIGVNVTNVLRGFEGACPGA